MAEIKTINNIPLADTTARENIATINEKINQLSSSVVVDATLTQSGMAADAKIVGDKFSELSDSIDALQVEASGEYGIYVGDTQPTNVVTYWLDTSENNSSDTEAEVTLSSIGATYSGGDVTVGTVVNSLSGIVVNATYSDGTTTTVTDYELSGSIEEGPNTITVTYQELTTTFIVNGVAEEAIYTTEVEVIQLTSGDITVYSDGTTEPTKIAKASAYTNAFESETIVQVKLILASTQYSTIRIGTHKDGEGRIMYYARKFNYSDTYAEANKEYIDTFTVPAGYGVMLCGWSDPNNVSSLTVMK